MGRLLITLGYVALALTIAPVFAVGTADAFSCAQSGVSGGIPGNEPKYTCTGLVESDVLTVTVDQLVNADQLNATATITVFDIVNGTALLDIELSNASSGGGQTNRLTSFGLGINPNALAGSVADVHSTGDTTTDTDALTTFSQTNFPGFNLVEFCATSNGNCAGGGSGGLQSGQTDFFRFTLTDGFVAGGTIDLSEFAFKFQGGLGGSYEKPGTPEGGGGPTQLPAPSAVALLGTGMLSLAIGSRFVRRRS